MVRQPGRWLQSPGEFMINMAVPAPPPEMAFMSVSEVEPVRLRLIQAPPLPPPQVTVMCQRQPRVGSEWVPQAKHTSPFSGWLFSCFYQPIVTGCTSWPRQTSPCPQPSPQANTHTLSKASFKKEKSLLPKKEEINYSYSWVGNILPPPVSSTSLFLTSNKPKVLYCKSHCHASSPAHRGSNPTWPSSPPLQ